MKSTLSFFLAFLLLCGWAGAEEARIVEDFSNYRVGELPESFKTYPFQRGKARRVYSVQKERGGQYLHADDTPQEGVLIIKKYRWNGEEWPVFSWRWRATALPRNGDTNDCACGVFVLFGGLSSGKSIKYIWSTTLPTNGPAIEMSPKYYTIIKESGLKNSGGWQMVSVNVVEDYRRLFGSDPKKEPVSFALLTDGDNTHSLAVCDYTDFKITTGK